MTPIADASTVAASDTTVAEGAANGDAESNRRPRRDRPRRERQPQQAIEGGDAPAMAADAAAQDAVETMPAALVEPVPLFTAAHDLPQVVTPAATQAELDLAEPAPALAPRVDVTPAAVTLAAAPMADSAPAMPAVQTYALPLGDLHRLAEDSGLQWVNSDADKISAVQAAIANTPQPIRVPRERKSAVVLDVGPLVLVETRRDLSAMKLPFEQAEAEPAAAQI